MTMYPDSVIKGFNIFKNKLICMIIVLNVEPNKPLSFNQRMK